MYIKKSTNPELTLGIHGDLDQVEELEIPEEVEPLVEKKVQVEELESEELKKAYTVKKEVSIVNTYKFKVCLHVYCTKNNISWVITDITKKQIYFKKTGGMGTKRGYLKNSQKVGLKNFEEVLEALRNIKADYVFCYIKHGFGTKKHLPTFKSALNILDTLKKTEIVCNKYVVNSTKKAVSQVRLKGGSKPYYSGRR